MFIYIFIAISIPTIGVALPLIIIGLDRVKIYFDEMNADSTATDNISMYGTLLTFSVFGGYYVMFIKKLGNIFITNSFLMATKMI